MHLAEIYTNKSIGGRMTWGAVRPRPYWVCDLGHLSGAGLHLTYRRGVVAEPASWSHMGMKGLCMYRV